MFEGKSKFKGNSTFATRHPYNQVEMEDFKRENIDQNIKKMATPKRTPLCRCVFSNALTTMSSVLCRISQQGYYGVLLFLLLLVSFFLSL